MRENITKIALWEPTEVLIQNVKKLNRGENCVVGNFTDSIDLSKNREFIEYKENMISEYDVMLIETAEYNEVRKRLVEKYNIPKDKILTFNEYWVWGCEDTITNQYHSYWEEMKQAGVFIHKNRTAIIFGGGSGIGKETALAFVKAGANVIISGRNEKKLQAVCDEFGTDKISYLSWDITEVASNNEKIREAEKIFHKPIDIVVNSAGVFSRSNFFEVTEQEYDQILGTNLKGVYFICQSFAEYFIRNQIKGHIVNVASNTGILPTVKPYGMSKWGVIGLTKGLGMNLAEYGIIVNGVAPGGVATEMAGWEKGDCAARRASKVGRVAFPCEVAQIILDLASFKCENMPGEVVVCDGGDNAINLCI